MLYLEQTKEELQARLEEVIQEETELLEEQQRSPKWAYAALLSDLRVEKALLIQAIDKQFESVCISCGKRAYEDDKWIAVQTTTTSDGVCTVSTSYVCPECHLEHFVAV
jgi:predicted nuclease with TOPRIM domain